MQVASWIWIVKLIAHVLQALIQYVPNGSTPVPPNEG